MATLNLCQFIGNVGADPEIRTFEGGSRMATARIAVTERYTDRNNQPQQRTEWVGLIFGGKLVDIVENYVKKGSSIYVSGKFHTREWNDGNGVKHTTSEIQVRELQLLSKPVQQEQYQAPAQAPRQQAPARPVTPPAPPAPTRFNNAPVAPQAPLFAQAPAAQPAPTTAPQFTQTQTAGDQDLPF